MTITAEKLIVSIGAGESVTALLYPAAKGISPRTTVLLGHGAGANQMNGFMRAFAAGLAARGFDTMTFNFFYAEQGRRAPDSKAKLESCYRAVIEAARTHKKLKSNRLLIGGKSMGGRIASQVAADASFWEGAEWPPLSKDLKSQRTTKSETKEASNKSVAGSVVGGVGKYIAGLIFLGYPLHPPGKPEQLRDKHLKDIQVQMLFLQGSRDAFGTPDELHAVIDRFHLPASLYLIEGGDHSFKIPKGSPQSQHQIFDEMMDEITRWWVETQASG
jgi:predicted alpha/beta-hydrolase family hydrolase